MKKFTLELTIIDVMKVKDHVKQLGLMNKQINQ